MRNKQRRTLLEDPLNTLLGPPHVLESEGVENFAELYSQIVATVAPKDIFDQLSAREIAEDAWEESLLRRWKWSAIACWQREVGIHYMMAPPGNTDERIAKVYTDHIDVIEKIDRRLTSIPLMRAATLDHIDARRRRREAARPMQRMLEADDKGTEKTHDDVITTKDSSKSS
jgi:hypothetical protein